MIIAGIDYSMTSPSICVFAGMNQEAFTFSKCKIYFLTDKKKYSGQFGHNIQGSNFNEYNQETERFTSIADWAVDIISGVDQIALEGYAYGGTGRVFHIAENTGILKYKIYKTGIPLGVYAPSAIKKFATGKGNADKELMYRSFVEETKIDLLKMFDFKGRNIKNPISDVVDSYFVCKRLYDEYVTSSV